MRKVLIAWAMAALAVLAPGWTLAGEADDEVVANQIAQNLKESGRLQNYRVGVAFRDGTAWLSGAVTDEEQLEAALEIARSTEGVQEVVNRLEAKPTVSASSQRISNRLRSTQQNSSQNRVQLTTSTVEDQVRQQAAQRSTWPGAQQQQAMRQQQVARRPAPQQHPQQMAQRAPGPQARIARNNTPVPYARTARAANMNQGPAPQPTHVPGGQGVVPARYDHAHMPNYAWPSYAAYPNYAAVTYPKQYSPTAWPYIGPFYPYPQVPLGWRKVTLQWDDGWWMLDFKEK